MKPHQVWTWVARACVLLVFLALGALLAFAVCSCGAAESDLKGAEYAGALKECNRTAATLCASVACENHERARAGRLPRPLPPSCLDGGAP